MNATSALRTLVVFMVGWAIWFTINIQRGSVAAIRDSGWFNGLSEPMLWTLALAGSALQWYVIKEWSRPGSLMDRSPLFRVGTAVFLFACDILFPARGLMASADKLDPWSWGNFGLAVVAQLFGSWYAQQAWTGAAEELVAWLFGRRPVPAAEPTQAPAQPAQPGQAAADSKAAKPAPRADSAAPAS